MITPEQLAANPSEHSQQAALFCWAAQNAHVIPELRLLFAIPNGGLRDKVTASRLKAEGVKAGVPDVFWPVSRQISESAYPLIGIYHGLFLEMKRATGKASEAQSRWVLDLQAQGYCCALAFSYEQARDAILNYYEGKPVNELRVPS